MIKCESCGRENLDSFKFCLDCGKPLTPEADQEAASEPPLQPEPPRTSTSPVEQADQSRVDTIDSPLAEQPSPQAATGPPQNTAAAQPVPETEAAQCPKCQAPVSEGDAFCANCGQNLREAVKPGATMFMHTAAVGDVQKLRVRLTLIKADGNEGTVFTLADKTTIGRSQGMIMFPKDPFISPAHADLEVQDTNLLIRDRNSLNGVYLKMTKEEKIDPGSYFRIGRQLLRLEVAGEMQPLEREKPSDDDSQFWGSPIPQVWARLIQVLEGGKIGEIYLLSQAEVLIGREEGDVRFGDDGFISSRHCKLTNRNGDCYLADLGSSNGTYFRIKNSHQLVDGDRIQIGNQVLRVDIN